MKNNSEIVCCGEAIMDMLPRQLADESDVFLPVEGGGVYNTAIALGRLNESVAYFGGISTDMFGQQLVNYLKQSSVNTGYLKPIEKPSTLAFVKLTSGHAEYTFMDENSAGRTLTKDMLPEFSEEVKALHFGGISLIPEPCGSSYETLMDKNSSSKIISFDPNIRESFIHDEASYRLRLNRLIGMSDIVKVSDEDLEWIYPNVAFEEIANKWIESGVSIVILTLGKSGARAKTATLDVTVPAQVTEVVDTVGAGDCFNAGVLSSLRSSNVLSKQTLGQVSEKNLVDALEFGTLIASFVVARAGAMAPYLNQIKKAD